jgi:hypothetical protein
VSAPLGAATVAELPTTQLATYLHPDDRRRAADRLAIAWPISAPAARPTPPGTASSRVTAPSA